MRHLPRCVLLALYLSIVPGAAKADDAVGLPALPAEPSAAGPDYRVTPLVIRFDALPSPRPSTIARLFAPPGAFAASSRHHMATFAAGGVEFVAEAMRERTSSAANLERSVHALDRLSAVGFKAGIPIGANDGVSFGVAANLNKRAEPAILVGRKHIDGSGVVADCTWTHGSHLQVSLDWRADHSSSPAGSNRAVEIAQGAAPREQGFHLTLSYLLAGVDAARGTSFGFAGRDARIAASDVAPLGAANRQDIQTALFFRTAF